MEARIAKLEADIDNIKTTAADIKIDIRSVRDKVDGVNGSLSVKIDGVKDSLNSAKIWALLLYIGLAAVLLGTMARGFGWL